METCSRFFEKKAMKSDFFAFLKEWTLILKQCRRQSRMVQNLCTPPIVSMELKLKDICYLKTSQMNIFQIQIHCVVKLTMKEGK